MTFIGPVFPIEQLGQELSVWEEERNKKVWIAHLRLPQHEPSWNGFIRSLSVDSALVLNFQINLTHGNIITSSSPATAIDVAYTLLELLTTTENCNEIKYLMGF